MYLKVKPLTPSICFNLPHSVPNNSNLQNRFIETSEKLLFLCLSFPRKWESKDVLIDSRLLGNDISNISKISLQLIFSTHFWDQVIRVN
jgi:hypothetical protein